VLRRALYVSLMAAAIAFVAPAYADESVQFTLGRVVRLTPDNQRRIGIRSTCDDPGGCKVNYTLKHGSRLLGGTQALLLPNTVETDYVTLTKRMAAALRKQRMRVTIAADVSDPAGNKLTQTKTVTLGPKKKRRR
jgi:hypothetical protein